VGNAKLNKLKVRGYHAEKMERNKIENRASQQTNAGLFGMATGGFKRL